MTDLLLLLLLAAWVGADTTAFGQVMVSQPLVAAWLAGWIVGDPGVGLAVGFLLQVVWGGVLPLGSSSFPLAGPAAVAAGALATWAHPGCGRGTGSIHFADVGVMVAALLPALLVGELGGRMVPRIRRARVSRAHAVREALERGDAGAPWRAVLRGTGQQALLGMAVTAAGLILGAPLAHWAARSIGQPDAIWMVAPLLGLALGMNARGIWGRGAWRLAWVLAIAGYLLWRPFP